jgi:sugar lactone lactonase YvrE
VREAEPRPGGFGMQRLKRIEMLVAVLAALSGWTATAQTVHFSGAQTTVTNQVVAPGRLAVDAAGDIYVTDSGSGLVLKETLTAGTYQQSVIPTSALLQPYGVAVDAKGNVYVNDSGHNRVLEESPSAVGYQESVFATSAVSGPRCIFADAAGNVWICDTGNNRLLKETPAGAGYVETVAGNGMNRPAGAAEDGQGNVYVSDFGNGRILKEAPSGNSYKQTVVTTAKMGNPSGIAVDGAGNLYVSTDAVNMVMKEALTSTGSYVQSVVASSNLNYPDGIALDAAGNLVIADTLNRRVLRQQMQGAEFGAAATGAVASGAGQSLVFTFDTAGTLAVAPVISRQGMQTADFAVANTSTCVPGQSYAVSASCTVDITFTPTMVGSVSGAAVLESSAGGLLATGFMHGTGTGPLVSFAPPSETVVGSGFTNPRSVFADAAGNVYVADTDNQRIVKETLAGGTYTQSVVPTSALQWPLAVAVDGNGNVYVSDTWHSREIKESIAPGMGGAAAATPVENVIVSKGLNYPAGIALDGAGNFYLADSVNNRILMESPASASATGYVANTLPITGLSNVYGVAVDATGNLYIADSGNNRILKETRSAAGSFTYAQTVIPTSTLAFPRSVAVDANGDLYICDTNNGRVVEEVWNGAAYTENVMRSGLASPDSVALDGSGNLYIADTANQRVLKETFATPPSLQFASTAVGSTSASQQVSVSNVGNTALSFPSPYSGSSPAISVGFSANAGVASACPATSAGHDPGADLVAGGTCVFSISFTPTFTGVVQGYLVLSDTNLNDASALQTVSLWGSATADTIKLALNAPSSSTYGNAVQVTAQLSNSSNQNAVGAGSVGFADQAGTFGTQPVAGAQATQSYLAATVGTAVLKAIYTPSDPTMDSAQAQAKMQVLPAPLTASAANVSRTYGAANPMFTGQVLGAVNGDSFQELFSCAASVSSAVGLYPIAPSVTGSGLSNYAVTNQNGQLTITAAQLSARANDATRAYGSANPVFTGAVTGAVNSDVLTETFATIATVASPVGSFAIVPAVSGASAGNYIPVLQNGTLTITAAQLRAKANDATRVYGAGNPVFTGAMTGAVNGDVLLATYTTTATASSAPGTYSLVPVVSGPAAGNYTPVLQNGTLTITAAELSAKANDVTRVYGLGNPTFTGTVTGAVNGDVLTATYTTTATASSAPGMYSIAPVISGAAAGNYVSALENGTLTITAAQISAKVNDVTRVYGVGNPTFTGTVTGAVNGDVLTATYTTTATASSAPGTYSIVPVVAGANLANYTQIITNGILTIQMSALTATAQDQTRVYGSANPVFTGTVTGAAPQDTFTESFATSATQTSSIGSYAIVPTPLGPALADYTVKVQQGTLKVTNAPLKVTAQSVSRSYGAANPQLTGQMQGVVNGDTLLVTFSTQADARTHPGTYPIHASVSGAALGNYAVVATDGALTVEMLPTSTTLTRSDAGAGGVQTLQAQVGASGGMMPAGATGPSGNVRFYAGKTMLAEVPLLQGAASWSGVVSGAGQTLTVVYQGDVDWQPSASAGMQLPPDTTGFWIKPVGDTTQLKLEAGQQAVYPLQVGPGVSGLYPGIVTFSVEGLPAGATATFSPAQLAATSGIRNVTLSVTVPPATSATVASSVLSGGTSGRGGLGAGEVLLALLLLPVAGARRLRTWGRGMKGMCLLLAASAAMLGMTGCGVTMGPGLGTNAKPVTYMLTVVMTTAGQQRSMQEALVVQPQ